MRKRGRELDERDEPVCKPLKSEPSPTSAAEGPCVPPSTLSALAGERLPSAGSAPVVHGGRCGTEGAARVGSAVRATDSGLDALRGATVAGVMVATHTSSSAQHSARHIGSTAEADGLVQDPRCQRLRMDGANLCPGLPPVRAGAQTGPLLAGADGSASAGAGRAMEMGQVARRGAGCIDLT